MDTLDVTPHIEMAIFGGLIVPSSAQTIYPIYENESSCKILCFTQNPENGRVLLRMKSALWLTQYPHVNCSDDKDSNQGRIVNAKGNVYKENGEEFSMDLSTFYLGQEPVSVPQHIREILDSQRDQEEDFPAYASYDENDWNSSEPYVATATPNYPGSTNETEKININTTEPVNELADESNIRQITPDTALILSDELRSQKSVSFQEELLTTPMLTSIEKLVSQHDNSEIHVAEKHIIEESNATTTVELNSPVEPSTTVNSVQIHEEIEAYESSQPMETQTHPPGVVNNTEIKSPTPPIAGQIYQESLPPLQEILSISESSPLGYKALAEEEQLREPSLHIQDITTPPITYSTITVEQILRQENRILPQVQSFPGQSEAILSQEQAIIPHEQTNPPQEVVNAPQKKQDPLPQVETSTPQEQGIVFQEKAVRLQNQVAVAQDEVALSEKVATVPQEAVVRSQEEVVELQQQTFASVQAVLIQERAPRVTTHKRKRRKRNKVNMGTIVLRRSPRLALKEPPQYYPPPRRRNRRNTRRQSTS